MSEKPYKFTKKLPRMITVDDELWDATKEAAENLGSNASATVRAALRAFPAVRELLPEESREVDDE